MTRPRIRPRIRLRAGRRSDGEFVWLREFSVSSSISLRGVPGGLYRLLFLIVNGLVPIWELEDALEFAMLVSFASTP